MRFKDGNEKPSHSNGLMKDYFDDLNRTVSFGC